MGCCTSDLVDIKRRMSTDGGALMSRAANIHLRSARHLPGQGKRILANARFD